jgi:hypothetical protein
LACHDRKEGHFRVSLLLIKSHLTRNNMDKLHTSTSGVLLKIILFLNTVLIEIAMSIVIGHRLED